MHVEMRSHHTRVIHGVATAAICHSSQPGNMSERLERLHSSQTLRDGMDQLARQDQPSTPTRSKTPYDSCLKKESENIERDADVCFLGTVHMQS